MKRLPVKFPKVPPLDNESPKTVPFSQSDLKLLIEKFDLPAMSSSLFLSQRVFVQRHRIGGFGTAFPKLGDLFPSHLQLC